MPNKMTVEDFRSRTYEGRSPSDTDWARMAAFIDGEGSILLNRRKAGRNGVLNENFYLRITVANTDIRLPEWCKEIFGGSYHVNNSEKYMEGHNWKKAYHWGTSSNRAAWILWNCLPYFIIKREQAEIGIELQDSMREFVRGGGRELPQYLVEERRNMKNRLTLIKADFKHPLAVEQAKEEMQQVAKVS